MAEALTQVAREWVKADATVLTELTRLTGKVPMPLAGPTDKNNLALRQFDDPDVVRRLHSLRAASGRRSSAIRNRASEH